MPNYEYVNKTGVLSVEEGHINMNVIVVNATYPDKGEVIVTSDVDGDYNVYIDGKVYPVSVVNGTGSVVVDTPGLHNVTVESNMPNYEKTNQTAELLINEGSIDMNVTIINPTYPDSGVVVVNSTADGEYIVVVNNKTYIINVVNGNGNVTIDILAPGDYDIEISSDVDNYQNVRQTTNLRVSKNDILTIKSADLKRGFNSDYDFRATFYDKYGGVLINTVVEFIIGGKTYTVYTDSSGVASVHDKLAVGNYTVISKNIMTGNENVNSLEIVPRLIENKNLVTDYNSGVIYKVRVIDDDGTPVGAGVKFDIPINGKSYSYLTDSKGYINIKVDKRFPASVSKKTLTYRFTLTYKDYTINNVVTIKQILKAKKQFKVKKSAKKLVLKATLKKSNGKALKGKKITFKFKGKTYKAKTNKKGIAKVTVKKNVIKKLKKGKNYLVKITYLTDTINSYVKVK